MDKKIEKLWEQAIDLLPPGVNPMVGHLRGLGAGEGVAFAFYWRDQGFLVSVVMDLEDRNPVVSVQQPAGDVMVPISVRFTAKEFADKLRELAEVHY